MPVGDNKDYFASYIGVVVRERVNINYTAWDEVPKEVINEVYDYITARRISLLVFFFSHLNFVLFFFSFFS